MSNNISLNKLKAKLAQLDLDFFILPNSDEFMSEYLPESAKRLQFITGFTGSNALVIIGKNNPSAFFTDGRYILQAAQEIDQKIFTIYNLSDKSPIEWLIENSKSNAKIAHIKIGFDPKLHSKNFIIFYQEIFAKNPDKNLNLIEIEHNPIDEIWENRPNNQSSKIVVHSLKYSGLTLREKLDKIINDFGQNSDALILNSANSICWLFNIRGEDILYSPLVLAYAIIYKTGKAQFFIDEKRLDKEVKDHLKMVEILPPKYLEEQILTLKSAQIDPSCCNYWLYSLLQKSEIKYSVFEATDPCLIHKAIKNPTEIKGAIEAHRLDGLALTKFLFWLEKSIKAGEKIDELSAAQKLLEFRKQNKEFLYPSFASISAIGANGAIIHYHPTKSSCLSFPSLIKVKNKLRKKFNKFSRLFSPRKMESSQSISSSLRPRAERGWKQSNIVMNYLSNTRNNDIVDGIIYLIDSGGQYNFGTTDVTRTIAIGAPSKTQIANFTAVLKGHIALACAKFPAGTNGASLDILARYFLWQRQKDYDHGTGHGVGSFSSVHEFPPSISKKRAGGKYDNDNILKAGMILSNEPGYYETGEYGIRIENLMLIENCATKKEDGSAIAEKFLQFKTLTLAPIDPKLIDFTELNKDEKQWLAQYHQEIYRQLADRLDDDERAWLGRVVNFMTRMLLTIMNP